MSTNTAEAKLNETGSRRPALNFWIDVATAIAFAGLIGTGMIMKWILPPGSCDVPGTVKVWLGHARHWWGDIHFWVAMGLLALIVVHTWLHWSWVLCLWRKLVGSLASPRTWALGTALAALMAIPWLIPPAYEKVPIAPSSRPVVDNTATAPCGIPGLSCESCPAAGDRLGGSAEKPAAVEDPCVTCPEAGKCGGESCAEEQPADGAAKADPCADCPKAGSCTNQAQQGS